MSVENALLHCDLRSEGKARGAAVLDGEDTGALRLSGGDILEEDTAGAGPGTEHVGLRHLPAFAASRSGSEETHKCTHWAVGRQGAHAPPGGAGGNSRAVFHLPSVCTDPCLALGQRDQYVQTDRGEKGAPHRTSTAG